MKIEGDKVFHHPVMVYPQSFGHDDIMEVVELKSNDDGTKGKHEELLETNAIGIDEYWSESGSTCSDHGEDCAVKNQTDNERCAPSSEDKMEIGDENIRDSEVAKVIVCCKDNTCSEVKDICIDQGVPSNLHISEGKEKNKFISSAEDLVNEIITPSSEAPELSKLRTRQDPSVLSDREDLAKADIGENVVSEDISPEATNHTDHGSDMKGLSEEYLISSSESPICEEVDSSASEVAQGSGVMLDPLNHNGNEKKDVNNQDNMTTLAALLGRSRGTNLATESMESGRVVLIVDVPAISTGTKERNSSDPVNQGNPKADAVPSKQPDSLEDRRDHRESSFSYADPVPGSVTYSGPIAYSGSLSLRSDSSTTSTRSFAFPILQNEWNSSPVRMAKGNRRRLRKNRGWRYGILCCRF